MRSSSIKSLVVVSSVVFTLSLATPSAEARSSQPPSGARTTIQRVVGKVLRFFGISSNEKPGDPWPTSATGPVTATFDPTTGTTTIR